jgi:hypothetical protein
MTEDMAELDPDAKAKALVWTGWACIAGAGVFLVMLLTGTLDTLALARALALTSILATTFTAIFNTSVAHILYTNVNTTLSAEFVGWSLGGLVMAGLGAMAAMFAARRSQDAARITLYMLLALLWMVAIPVSIFTMLVNMHSIRNAQPSSTGGTETLVKWLPFVVAGVGAVAALFLSLFFIDLRLDALPLLSAIVASVLGLTTGLNVASCYFGVDAIAALREAS